MRTSLAIALALALSTLASCSGSSDPAALNEKGYTALNERSYEAAHAHFVAALEAIDAQNPLYLQAKLGACRAQAHIEPAAAKQAFLALASARQSDIRLSDYTMMVGELKVAGEEGLDAAIDLCDAGRSAFPEKEAEIVSMMQDLQKLAASSGNTKAANKIKNLGYVGEDF